MQKAKVIFIILILSFGSIIAQDVTPKIDLPTGFDWLYLVFFAVGMIVHYAVKVFHILGSAQFFSGLLRNFIGWFINKWHYSALAGAAAACFGVGAYLGLDIGFTSINTLGIVASLVAGYMGDSMFNSGNIA